MNLRFRSAASIIRLNLALAIFTAVLAIVGFVILRIELAHAEA
jgi:hypothetical protein